MNLNRLKIKSFFAFPILTLGLALGACSEESGVESPQEPSIDRGQTVTFKANPLDTETKSVGTKVSLNPQINPANPDELTWESTDKISFHFFDRSTNHHFTPADGFSVSVSADGSADLTGDIPANAGTYNMYAISPMSADNFKSNQLGFRNLTIPQVQVQNGNRNTDHISDYLYLYAKMDDALEVRGTDDWTGTTGLDFQLIPSILRFDIENWSGKDLKLKDLKISYPDAGTSTLYQTYRLYEDSGDGHPIASSAYESITLDMQSELLNQNDVYSGYIVLFPTTKAGKLNIDLSFTFEDYTVTIPMSADVPDFYASTRSIISLHLDRDLIYSVLPDVGVSTINDNLYKTLTINRGTNNELTIMIDPVDWGIAASEPDHAIRTPMNVHLCNSPWRMPTTTDLDNLLDAFNSRYAEYAPLFYAPIYVIDTNRPSKYMLQRDAFIIPSASFEQNDKSIVCSTLARFNHAYPVRQQLLMLFMSNTSPRLGHFVQVRCVKS